MATESELRFRAVLQDDASRGMEQLEAKVKRTGSTAATANREIGSSATRAATQVTSSTSKMASAYGSTATSAKRASGGIASALSGAVSATGAVVRTAATRGREIGEAMVTGIKDRVSKAKGEVGERLKDIGRGAAQAFTVALGGVGVGLGVAIKSAAEYEQSVGAIESIFKSSSAQMFQFAADAQTTMGLSRNEYNELATVLGASLKNGGTSMDELGGKTNGLLQTGADLASMFGGTTKDAVTALTATLRGEYDPIERYGISLRAASVEAKAVEMGLMAAGDEMTNSAKQTATLALIMDQTKDATGNFARETTTLSGATAILRAKWENFYTALGTYVIPIVAKLVGWLSDKALPAVEGLMNGWAAFWMFVKGGSEADWGVLEGFDLTMQNLGLAVHNAAVKIKEMWEGSRPFFDFIVRHKDVFAHLALGIGIAATAMGVLTAATWLLNAALAIAFSPVVIIGAFIGAVILAYNKIGWFKDWVNDTWATIKVGAEAVGKAIVWVFNNIVADGKNLWSQLTTLVGGAVNGIRDGWNALGNFFTGLWNTITSGVLGFVARVVSVWSQLIENTRREWDGIKAVVSAVVGWLTGTAVAMWDGAARALGAVMTWLRDTIVKPVWDGIRLAIAVVIGIILTLWDGIVYAARTVLGPVFTWLRDTVVKPVWSGIQAAIQAVASWWTGTAVPGFRTAITNLSNAWNVFKALVATVWTAIRTAIQVAWNFIQNNILNPAISFIRGAFTNAWNFIRDAVVTVWTRIRDASSQAWNFLRDNVFNPVINFIRGAFNAAWTWIRDQIRDRWQNTRDTSSQAWNFLRDSVFNPIINFIRGAFTAAWNFIRDTITERWAAIRTVASQAWNFLRDNVFTPIINFLRNNLTSAWNFIRDTITNAWNAIRDRVRSGWDSIRTGTFDPLVRFVRETIPNAFSSARDAIGRAWDGIKSRVIDPINEVIRVIKNVLIGNINNVLKEFGMKPINVGFNAASGGSFKVGGYTGPGDPNQVAGVVHKDEQVIRSPARRSIEDTFPGLLDNMNRKGAAALGAAAPGASVYNGVSRSFSGGLTQRVFEAGRLNVSGSAPGYDLAGAIRMLDNATKVKVASGSGAPNVNVATGPISEWWAGYFDGNGIRINTNVAGGLSPASKRILVAHEIGHALGLPHSDPSGLKSMMSYANMYQHNSVTAADVAALSAIYGGTGFGSSGGGGIDILGLLTKGVSAVFDRLFNSDNLGAKIAGGGGRFLMKKAAEWAGGLGAARGLSIPGYLPGTDNIPVMASPGESVLTPQLTAALGRGNITAANLHSTGGRAGGPGGAVGLLGRSTAGNVSVQVNVTIEGNVDNDVMDRLENELDTVLEAKLIAILDRSNRREY